MTFRVRIEPVFLQPDNPAQGIDRWAISFEGLPEFNHGSDKQVRWANAIREKSMRAFIEHALKDDDYAVIKRHWYDADARVAQAAAEEAFTAYFTPIIAYADLIQDWIDALGMDRIQEDPTIIVELTEMMRVSSCNPQLRDLRLSRRQRLRTKTHE